MSYIVYNNKSSFYDIIRAFREREVLEGTGEAEPCLVNDWLSPRPLREQNDVEIGSGSIAVRENPPAFSSNPFLRNVVLPHQTTKPKPVDTRVPFPSPCMLVQNKEWEPLLLKVLKCVEATGAHKDSTRPTNVKTSPWKKAFNRVYGGGIKNAFIQPESSDRYSDFKTSVLSMWKLLEAQPKHPCRERSARLYERYKKSEQAEQLQAYHELKNLRKMAFVWLETQEAKSPNKNNNKRGPTKKITSIQSKQNPSKAALPKKARKGSKKIRPEKATKTLKQIPKAATCVVLSVPLVDKLKSDTASPCVVTSLPQPMAVYSQHERPPSPRLVSPQPFVPYRNPSAGISQENDGYGSDWSIDSLVF